MVRAVVAAMIMIATIAGCIGGGPEAPGPDAMQESAEPAQDEETDGPQGSGGSESTGNGSHPAPGSNLAAGNSTQLGENERPPWFESPPAIPGQPWRTMTFSADVPAGDWLFVYQPFAGGPRSFEDELPVDMTMYGEPTGDGPTAYMTTSAFLLDAENNKVETFFLEQEAGFDPDGGSWQVDTFWEELQPFGDRTYDGVGFLGASLTDWHVEINITAPEIGNGLTL